jgi:hypothetical protein
MGNGDLIKHVEAITESKIAVVNRMATNVYNSPDEKGADKSV